MKHSILIASTALLAACATRPVEPLLIPPSADAAPAAAAPIAPAAAVAPVPAKNAELAAFFEEFDKADLALQPLGKAFRGIKDEDYGKWGDFSDAGNLKLRELGRRYAAELQRRFDRNALSPDDRLSYDLFLAEEARNEALFRFNDNGYVFDQMNGAQSQLPAFLINIHRVENASDAEAYVSRILLAGPAVDQLTAESRERAAKGVMPPRWVYPLVIGDIDNQLKPGKGAMLVGHPVLDDFREKVAKLDIPQAQKDKLVADAVAAWKRGTAPAYRRLRAELVRQQPLASADDGIWRLPDGAGYYDALLANYTTTNLTADQVHDLGLKEIARIQAEMREIMGKVGYQGTLQQFFEHARTDPKFYPKTREEYLAKVDTALAAMEKKLPEYFATLPKDKLVVKPVEPFREKTAGKAFYQGPTPDGSRPGTYYVNLYDLKAMSLNELEALAFHEGIPGHHLQRSIQTALGEVPPFRRFGGVTAYTEGWGLYSEELGKDMGFYADPYADLGRLSMESLRAGRLVVDTGIHSKRWSRQQAIDWFLANTPVAKGDIVSQVERYVVFPGQATAYMVGKLKIEELRDKAQRELGDKFDIRQFHDVVLLSGPVPLDVLERRVDAWVADAKTHVLVTQ